MKPIQERIEARVSYGFFAWRDRELKERGLTAEQRRFVLVELFKARDDYRWGSATNAGYAKESMDYYLRKVVGVDEAVERNYALPYGEEEEC